MGTVVDPATTRLVTQVRPIRTSGIVATATGYVRDPFGTCPASTTNFTLRLRPESAARRSSGSGCPEIDEPLSGSDQHLRGLVELYRSSPILYEHSNAFDVRGDFNPIEKDQIFVRFSYVDDPQYIPGLFGGIADGGGFQQGIQTAEFQSVGAG